MLMLNHSDSREDSLPKQGGLTNGSRSDSASRIELGLGSSSPTASQVQPKDQAGSANCTRHPTTSNGVPSPAGSQRPAYTTQPAALNLMQFVEPSPGPPGGPSPPKTPSPASVAAAEA
ncbi:uncharacterized protein TNIN_224011 [Trichonephila inaurata madagascariensis]|uniref:Uncharacterized protein n=1 Tax=Trichonephila inaurata madagascariensis TaxID=2747483 RepID=A0A8X6X2F4_9ARAC|nr:uncharacterized protein TNIN_224011 [Trichonephila inaurata madagascariensis]